MTPEAQRIAVAEACGWKFYCVNHFKENVYHHSSGLVATDNPIEKDHVLPDYLNDLNAMHEAEKVALKTVGWMTYAGRLFKVLESNSPNFGPLFHATAVQRAEAFLKAIGKWE